jgi:hypothetical protein
MVCSSSSITIDKISEPTILQYFETLGAENFTATAALFAADGELHPPFETAIVGPEAIATYLQAEAQGLTLAPREGETLAKAGGHLDVQIIGKVSTALFTVNVAWQFTLNSHRQIVYARVKLLASPQELLALRDRQK